MHGKGHDEGLLHLRRYLLLFADSIGARQAKVPEDNCASTVESELGLLGFLLVHIMPRYSTTTAETATPAATHNVNRICSPTSGVSIA